MNISAYLNPDFTTDKKIFFFLLCLGGVLICDLIILIGNRAASLMVKDKGHTNERFLVLLQLFYEMIISATSVMSFACAYVVLNHVYSLIQSEGLSGGCIGQFVEIWENWKDFILLILILLSCVLNTILDRLLIPLYRIDKENRAAVRMLAMFYAIIVLICLNSIGDESEYSPVMMYYLGLMVGRFVYFDASFMDFLAAIKNVFLRSPLLLLGFLLSGILTFFGFKTGYFLERNYYIVGVLLTHIFLLAAVFVIRNSRIMELIFRVEKKEEEDYEEYEEESDL